jgi:hypothetical protein
LRRSILISNFSGMLLPAGNGADRYAPSRREEVFSETELPIMIVLGNRRP